MAESNLTSWLIVGRVVKPHGVHGNVLIEVITDFPDRLSDGVRFGLGSAEGPEHFHTTHSVRFHKGQWLVAVSGMRDREAVDGWRGQYVFLPEQALEELPDGYVYEHHVVGLPCRSLQGEELGEVVAMDTAGGQTRLVVRRGRRRFMVPFVAEIVVDVDLADRVVTIDAFPGLLDDDSEQA